MPAVIPATILVPESDCPTRYFGAPASDVEALWQPGAGPVSMLRFIGILGLAELVV